VDKARAPLDAAGLEIDLLQLAPIALANMLIFDQLPDPATIDPENPPPSIVLVSIGCDSTDLVVSNGLRIWQRSMPIGGNSFTKALVKELKYTFAKAEQEKRNAVRAADPRAVFKAMRPVFVEFASELQRSLNYFTGTDRKATIGKVLLLGNAAKLRGLADFVGKQLQLEVQRLDKFAALEGPTVLQAPAFRENRLAFATAYGLALQAAGGASLRTNLLPPEIARDRLVARKRPWAVAALAGLLVAGLLNFAGKFVAWKSYAAPQYPAAFAAADEMAARSTKAVADLEQARQTQQEALSWQQYLVRVHERRFQTIDLLRAVTSLLPHDPPDKVPEDPADRNELHVDALGMQYFPDLATWFRGVQANWQETMPAPEAVGGEANVVPDPNAAAAPNAVADTTAADATAAAGPPTPRGPGWVVQITGHHFHNEDRHKPDEGEQFVRSTIVKNLLGEGAQVTVSAGPLAGTRVSPAELGIGYPVIVMSSPVRPARVPVGGRPDGTAPGAAPAGGPAGGTDDADTITLQRYDFILQFAWQPQVPGAAPPPAPPPARDVAAP